MSGLVVVVTVLLSSSVLACLRLTESLSLGRRLSLTGWLVTPQSPLVRGHLTMLGTGLRLSCYHCSDLVTWRRPPSPPHLPTPASKASLTRWRSGPNSGSSVKSHM